MQTHTPIIAIPRANNHTKTQVRKHTHTHPCLRFNTGSTPAQGWPKDGSTLVQHWFNPGSTLVPTMVQLWFNVCLKCCKNSAKYNWPSFTFCKRYINILAFPEHPRDDLPERIEIEASTETSYRFRQPPKTNTTTQTRDLNNEILNFQRRLEDYDLNESKTTFQRKRKDLNRKPRARKSTSKRKS